MAFFTESAVSATLDHASFQTASASECQRHLSRRGIYPMTVRNRIVLDKHGRFVPQFKAGWSDFFWRYWWPGAVVPGRLFSVRDRPVYSVSVNRYDEAAKFNTEAEARKFIDDALWLSDQEEAAVYVVRE